MVKPVFRRKSIGAKVSEEEYAQLEALAGGRAMSEWAREVLLRELEGRQARPADETLLAEVLSYANSGYLITYEKARYLAIAGDSKAALATLRTAESRRDSWLVYAGIEPAFDSLRASTEFQRLLRDIGFDGLVPPNLPLDPSSKLDPQTHASEKPSKYAQK